VPTFADGRQHPPRYRCKNGVLRYVYKTFSIFEPFPAILALKLAKSANIGIKKRKIDAD
jgi:hypothetical protein